MVSAITLEILKDLLQLEYQNKYYDIHNDYNCARISYLEKKLFLFLEKIDASASMIILFNQVDLVVFNTYPTKDNGTIDSFYRGRTFMNEALVEETEDEKGYFYLEFYEGQKIEFWAKSLEIQESPK
ncbi:MAG: hypothetical protein BGO56_02050 [Sphingobacteriales bacterium 48-107]|nr:MAG: hypothetical protein BGO56_02050 [Sphingobacteriales bacterium 48-107]